MNNIADYKWDLHGKPDCFNFYQETSDSRNFNA